MKHLEFCKKYIGQAPIEPGMKTVECVYLPKLYCKEMGHPIGAFGGSAWNGWVTGSPFDKSWKRVEYKLGLSPSEGDILFWSEKRCKNGHTGVASKFCNEEVLRYIDMNGTGHRDLIQARFTDYKNLIGWFTRKNTQ